MTRFMMEYTGKFGDFWKREADKKVIEMQTRYDDGEIIIEEDGAAKWKSSGNYIPEDCAEMLSFTRATFDIDATARKRSEQNRKAIENYRKNFKPSEEMLMEMANEFRGETVVDVFTGKKYHF